MTPRQQSLLRLMQRHPDGLGLIDLITATGGTHHTVAYDLRALRGEGLVGPSDIGGSGVLWATSGDLGALKAKRAATRAALAAQAKERAARRELSAQEREAEEAACEAFASPPVRRILPQADWVGLAAVRGVASVFQLGAAA